jgi:hypothetical protein
LGRGLREAKRNLLFLFSSWLLSLFPLLEKKIDDAGIGEDWV